MLVFLSFFKIFSKSFGKFDENSRYFPETGCSNPKILACKNCLSNIGDELRPGIVHRIDKDTSGLVVVAKNNFSHENLSKQFN